MMNSTSLRKIHCAFMLKAELRKLKELMLGEDPPPEGNGKGHDDVRRERPKKLKKAV